MSLDVSDFAELSKLQMLAYVVTRHSTVLKDIRNNRDFMMFITIKATSIPV